MMSVGVARGGVGSMSVILALSLNLLR
ncbi:conserved hypothetical protein [Burkholderia cenocepacia]|nr:conserved hypothetical protein [Burkholderia cenocepacia]